MKKMTMLAMILVLAIVLAACGSKEVPETTTTVATTVPTETAAPAEPLALASWEMSASTWSSPNGATIHISATPNYYSEGQRADFIVRLESDDVASIPCQWDGTVFTASADLNAANGYCYYIVLTAADGTSTEFAVNTPTEPVNEAFINMEAALASYCSITVEGSEFSGSNLTLTAGKVQVQAPAITNDGNAITCQEVTLILSYNGQELSKETLTLAETDTSALYEADLAGISFNIPQMEDDQKVELTLNAVLSNGQTLSSYGGNWIYNAEALLPVVG